MGRRDMERLTEWLRSNKDSDFKRGIRIARWIMPKAICYKDNSTCGQLADELISAFWYWDERVPKVVDWTGISAARLDRFLKERERLRARRNEIGDVLNEIRVFTRRVRSGHGGKQVVKKVLGKILAWERKWNLIVLKRTAEGESEEHEKVRVFRR
jgi:hypothetical protein